MSLDPDTPAARLQARLDRSAPRRQESAARHSSASVAIRSGLAAPLTSTQDAIWYQAQVDPGDPRHHRPTVVRLRGPVDLERLERALARMVDRHPTLATAYPLVGNRPRQHPSSPGDDPDRVRVRLKVVGAERDPAAAGRVVAGAARRSFDLTHPETLEATVVRRRPEDHLLVLALSHLAIDGPSAQILVSDLLAAYDGTGALPALSTTFADWAAARDGQAGPDEREAHLAWWSLMLAHRAPHPSWPGLEPVCASGSAEAWPTDDAIFVSDGTVVEPVAVPDGVAQGLRALARSESVSLHAVALAAFSAWSWTHGIDDLVVAVPVTDRDHPDLEGVVGCFVRVLPVRLRAAPADTGRVLLGRAAAVTQVVLDHRMVALPDLTATLATRGASGRADELVDAHVQYRPVPGAPRSSESGLEAELLLVLDPEPGPNVVLMDDGARMRVVAVMPDADPDAGRALAEAVVHQLTQMVRSPDRPLAGAVPAAEPEGGTRSADLDVALGELFDRVEAAHPGRPAVRDHAQVVTYAELGRRARAAAAELVALGVVPGDRITLVLDRSVDWVVAMLAVVMAGGVYVPIDPGAPASRTAAMVADAGPVATIGPAGMARLDRGDGGDDPIFARAQEGPTSSPVYVLFTSGSTGRPKGVVVTHRNVVQLVRDPAYLPIEADDVVAFTSNPIFDGTTIEVWGALLNGACLAIPDEASLLDPARLETLLSEWGVTVVGMATALFHAVARHRPGAFSGLRVLVFGGESAEPRWVQAVLDAGPPSRLVHDYGPTETTCVVSYHDVVSGSGPMVVVPIGRPLVEARFHVLDGLGRPMPDGVPGELHIGGEGVARGYAGRPELTALQFGPDPFSARPGARLYRSGDLVVRRPDGQVVFLGRVDTQLKIRGYRVELGEIESALTDHPLVEAAAVRAWAPHVNAEPRLVGYVVVRPGAGDDLSERLSEHLRHRLPAYMVPRPILAIAGLPLTATGKVDRSALPSPRFGPADEATRPDVVHWRRDPLVRMVQLWRTVLETPDVGPDDHFFDIGGHSLRALALLAVIGDEFRVDLRVADLASADTPRALTEVLGSQERLTGLGGVVELTAGPTWADPVVFIPPGMAIHFLTDYRRLAQHLDLDRPTVTFEPPGMAPGTVPRSTVAAAATWYLDQIDRHLAPGPLRLIGHSLGAVLALEVARLARAAGRPVAAVDLIDPRLPDRPATGVHRLRVEASALRRRARAELRRAGPWDRLGRGPTPHEAANRQDEDLRVAAGHALARYRPTTYRESPVALAVAWGTDDRPSDARGGPHVVARWGPLLPEAEVIELSGHHIGLDSVLAEPYVAATAAALRHTLA